jgi:hypothetical protein
VDCGGGVLRRRRNLRDVAPPGLRVDGRKVGEGPARIDSDVPAQRA